MNVEKACEWCCRFCRKLRSTLAKQFAPAIVVGNPGHARKRGECDGDDERLMMLNKTWCQALNDDSWMKKLMSHVHVLIQASLFFFLIFFVSGLTLEAKHPVFVFILACFAATIPYWLWIASWRRKIEIKVFAEFRKRFGDHFHLG